MAIYLDHNATTPLAAEVLEAMLPYLRQHYANPSALHEPGRRARAAIERAREQVAALAGAHPSQVIFTSGGTEANNLALKGCMRGMGLRRLAVSAVEHASVREPARELGATEIGVDEQGRVSPRHLAACLREQRPQLLSVMLANNETGVVQDIAGLAGMAREAGVIVHTDAVQAAGKLRLDFAASGVHMLSLSAHKIRGPKGVGALVVDKALELAPLLSGGGQEKGRRSGTENVAGIVGFGCAAERAAANLAQRRRRLAALRDALEARLAAIDGISVFGAAVERLPNTSFFAVDGIDGETLLMSLDVNGVAVASGSACASKQTTPSHVLMAMGVNETLARGAIRVSLGEDNTLGDIERFVAILKQQTEAARRMSVLAP